MGNVWERGQRPTELRRLRAEANRWGDLSWAVLSNAVGVGREGEGLQVEAEFDLPWRVSALVQSGRWPADRATAQKQNSHSLVSADRIRRFAPEESMIYLEPPPFHTLAAEASWAAAEFWREHGALHEVDPERALVIGDFGLGSDAPIILQYGQPDEPPSVWRLNWTVDANNNQLTHWVEVARTFDEFAETLGFD